MSVYDELAEKKADDEWDQWKAMVMSSKDEIAEFVSSHVEGSQNPKVVDWRAGSFNLCLQVKFDNDIADAMIRFPGLGHSAFREEKTLNEVQAINFIIANTTIPVPKLLSWGLTNDSPNELGPFIISEFVQGYPLSVVLADRTDRMKRLWLSPTLNAETLDTIYDQVADFLLQLYEFDFPRIGAISKDITSDSWSVNRRPLTYSMNEIATSSSYPVDTFHTGTFEFVTTYFEALTKMLATLLRTQRNFCSSAEKAERLYVSQRLLSELAPRYTSNDSSPFKLFCDDLRFQNMLVDPETLQITAVLDLEFTNAMPEQFASEPPWLLLLIGPEGYLFRGKTMEEFKTTYEPFLQQFLEAVRRAEAARGLPLDETRLSSRMLRSWQTNQFWFNFAMRKPIDAGVIFEECLIEEGQGVHSLEQEAQD